MGAPDARPHLEPLIPVPEATLPRLRQYLDALPGGLDAYPGHVQKASVYRQFLAATPSLDGLAEHLPEPLAELVLAPAPASVWLPEVHVTALYFAAADFLRMTPAAYRQHWYRVNRALLESPLYRVLMALASPERILRGAETRWKALHRGVTFTLTLEGPGQVGAALRYPAHLLPEAQADGYATAFQAAIELSGGKDTRFHVAAWAPTELRIEGRWR